MSKLLNQKPLILASGSSIRFNLLKSLGLDFLVVPSQCDEDGIKASFQSNEIIDLGHLLAKTKALEVSGQHPDHYVIAADQLCIFGDKVLDKPMNHPTAITQLQQLSGHSHQQVSCVCIAINNELIWQYHDIAYLTMRHLSESTITSYVSLEKPYYSCGAYQFESLGKWLFSEVQGREDTILGLPLFPLTDAMISLGIVSL